MPGWPYSIIAALEPGRTSWTAVLDAVRLGSDHDATDVTTTQVRGLVARLREAGQHRDGDPDILVVFDAGYDVCRLAFLFADLPVQVLGRIRSDRVLYAPAAAAAAGGRGGRPPRHGAAFALARAQHGPPPRVATITDTSRYGRAHAQAWDRLHPRLEHRGAWTDHPGDLPIVEGTLIRLQVTRLPGQHDPKPLWLWWSQIDATPADVDRCWQAFLRRFDLEHTFRMFKQTLGWTVPKIRDPAAGDRWTWLIIVAYTQLRLARTLTDDLRRPWERPAPPERLTPARVRRGFRHLHAKTRHRPARRNPPTPVLAARPAPRTPGQHRTTPSGKTPNPTQQSRSPRSAQVKRQVKILRTTRETFAELDLRRVDPRRLPTPPRRRGLPQTRRTRPRPTRARVRHGRPPLHRGIRHHRRPGRASQPARHEPHRVRRPDPEPVHPHGPGHPPNPRLPRRRRRLRRRRPPTDHGRQSRHPSQALPPNRRRLRRPRPLRHPANEGASKGILVTTSGYGKASHEFANGKPIELLDGANLLYLLREHAGLEARIEAPEDWHDPEPDQAPIRDEQPATTPARVHLRPGQNVALDTAALTITISWRTGAHDLDASAILLNQNGRVRSDADFVFYNQPTTPDGAIRHTASTPGAATATETLHIALDALHPDVHRVVAAVSVDGGRLTDIHDLRITSAASPATEYAFPPAATVETALICLEIYRRDRTWRLRAVGQGYADGLAGLARDFGVDVA